MKKSSNVIWWILILVLAIIIIIFGNNSFTKLKNDKSSENKEIDQQTIDDIYNVLWQKNLGNWPDDLPIEFSSEKIAKISPTVFGNETFTMLQEIKTKTIPLVQRYPERYDLLSEISKKGLTTNQVYNIADVMGDDYFWGYDGMKSIKEIIFPKDYSAHSDFQLGWYFFASSLKDQNGNYVDLLVNFLRRAVYSPPIAQKLGMSEIDNQMVELQLGLSLSDKNLHIQGADPVISGKTGLIKLENEPFLVKVGKNEVKSTTPGSLFPLTINVYDPKNDLKIDLTLEQTKPIFLEGDNGKVPSMYNLGTWYYSMPSIKTTGTITYQGDTRTVNGKTWFDNQWTAGVMPTGYPDNYYIRALANILNGFERKTVEPWGWDWVEVQLDNNIDITLASMHSVYEKDLQNHGENPPANASRDVTGKLINAEGVAENINGTMQITDWTKSYVSGAWYPNKWEVQIPSENINFVMIPTANGQVLQGKSASEFREGGVVVTGTMNGSKISGVGFGEGTNYAGEEYTTNTVFDILEIDDSTKNRDLFNRPIPGFWLVLQSILFYIVSAVVVIWLIVFIFHKIFHKKNQ